MMKQVSTQHLMLPDGAELHYAEIGQPSASRPSVLMLHSLFFNGGMFLPVIQALQNEWHIICPDHRNQGLSTAGQKPATMHQLAQDYAFLAQALRISSLHVVGSSMGGYVAQELMQCAPQLVRSAVLSCCTSMAEQQKERFDQLEAQLRRDGGAPYVSALLQTMFGDAFLASTDLAAQAQQEQWRDYFAHLPPSIANSVNGVFARPDYQSLLAGNSTPHLLISGALDRAKKPADMEHMHSLLPHSTHTVFEQSGHTAPVEAPEAFALQIENFWNQVN
ncbi:alpha/beta fold hydrolase [Alcaligenes nematophilus]